MAYGSVRKFNELSAVRTKDALLAKLRPMFERDGRLKGFTCIPDARWITLSTMTESDIRFLDQFPVWSVDEPGAYSSADLSFDGAMVKRILYTWRPFEGL